MSAATAHPLTTQAQQSESDLLQSLQSHSTGLTTAGAQQRLRLEGPNTFNTKQSDPGWKMLLRDFLNPLVLVLIAISGVSFFLRDYLNAGIVLTMVFLSVILNFFQEYRANQAAAKLQSRLTLMCTVLRDGQAQTIPSSQLCRGDILTLEAGDLISADARLLAAKDFFVNQAALTGESFPIEKIPGILPAATDLNGLTNMILSGTNVVSGNGTAVVVRTGLHSEYGQIAQSLSRANQANDFTLGIQKFSRFLLRIILVFVMFVFAINWLIKHDFLSSLSFAVAVAVGLTPEFLPMILSVTMSRGAIIMAKKGVIVKKLTAIPSFGSMNVLCTDKTGTLTQDHIQLVQYVDCSGQHSEDVLRHAYLCSAFHTGVSNPLDEAIKTYKPVDISGYRKVDEIPFDYERKRMSVVVDDSQQRWLITKGAPEEVLGAAGFIHHGEQTQPLNKTAQTHFQTQYQQLSSEGFRVLAVARRQLVDQPAIYTKVEEHDLELLGLVAFLDPVRPQVKDTLAQLERNGIEIKVITGDNELVTKKICLDAGVPIKGILLGHELAQYSEDALTKKCQDTTIFARFSPQQKERVIHHLKEGGQVIGYLGDGINDAPSLLTADVGISVENAVDVAKESADMILTTKNLQQLIDGVLEGRQIFANTMKYLMMGMSSNFGNMFSVLIGVFFLPFLPMLPIQILLNNFLYDLSQIAIPTDRVDPEMVQQPRRWNMTFIKRFMYVFGPISSLFDIITYVVLLRIFHVGPALFWAGWFMESLATQTLVIFSIRTRRVPFFRSPINWLVGGSAIAIVALGWFITLGPLHAFFEFGQPTLPLVLSIVLIVATYLVLVEIGKIIFYRWLVPAEA